MNEVIDQLVEYISEAPTTVIMLVGLPGCGKSTLTQALLARGIKLYVASTDDLLQAKAVEAGQTYDEAWSFQNLKLVEKEFKANLLREIENKSTILIDMTNLTRTSRLKKFNLFPANYNRVIVEFNVEDALIKTRLNDRSVTGKTISSDVLERMRSTREEITLQEIKQLNVKLLLNIK